MGPAEINLSDEQITNGLQLALEQARKAKRLKRIR